MAPDIRGGLLRPEGGHLGAFQWPSSFLLCRGDRLLQHRFLSRVQSGRKRWIAGRPGAVPDPKIHSTVSRQQDRIMRHEVVMDPTGGNAERYTEQENSDCGELGDLTRYSSGRPIPSNKEGEDKKGDEK